MRKLKVTKAVSLQLGVWVALAMGAGATRHVQALQSPTAASGAVQQSNQLSDLDITRNIRRALIRDKSLSLGAHNVAIITKDGKVMLKGRVASGTEKQTVETTAASVAGAQNVQSQLTYKQ